MQDDRGKKGAIMKRLVVAMAVFASVFCLAWSPSDEQTGEDKRECGPSLPGNADGWADSHEGNNALAIKVKKTSGPTGPGWQYYVSLTSDHYAGPNGVD